MRPLATVVEGLRGRIEALTAAPAASGGAALAAGALPRPWTRLAWRLAQAASPRRAAAPALSEGAALRAELDAVGVHTSLDAWLLRQLRSEGARAARLCAGLDERARAVAAELEAAVVDAELRVFWSLGLAPGTCAALQRGLAVLSRAAKVAAILAAPAAPHGAPLELLEPRGASSVDASAPGEGQRSRASTSTSDTTSDTRLEAAQWLWERGRHEVIDLEVRTEQLEWALGLLRRAEERSGATARAADRARRRRLRGELEHALAREGWARALGGRPGGLSTVSGQLRAAARGGGGSAWAALRALYERAVEAGDADAASRAAAALATLAGSEQALRLGARRLDALRSLGLEERAVRGAPSASGGGALEPSAPSTVGDDVTRTLERPRAPVDLDAALAELALGLTDEAAGLLKEAAALRWASGLVQGPALDQGGGGLALAQGVGARREAGAAAQTTLDFERTGDLSRLGEAVAPVAERLLVDLAAGELLVRRLTGGAVTSAPSRALPVQTVLLLDASGSMLGVRARLRDALLVSELSMLRVRAAEGAPWAPLRYAYFAEAPEALVTVGSGAEAAAHALEVLSGGPAAGRGDLALALERTLASLAGEDRHGPWHLVVVTDGEDSIEPSRVALALRELPAAALALTVVCLGEPNDGLERLVAAARRAGRRATYELVGEAEVALLPSDFDARVRTLVPERFDPGPDALARLAPHLEALEALAARREDGAPRADAVSAERFDALFPRASSGSTPPPAPPPAGLVAAVADVLQAVAETVAVAPKGMRAGEAAALLVHLLSLREVSVARYLQVASGQHPEVRAALATIRILCRAPARPVAEVAVGVETKGAT